MAVVEVEETAIEQEAGRDKGHFEDVAANTSIGEATIVDAYVAEEEDEDELEDAVGHSIRIGQTREERADSKAPTSRSGFIKTPQRN